MSESEYPIANKRIFKTSGFSSATKAGFDPYFNEIDFEINILVPVHEFNQYHYSLSDQNVDQLNDQPDLDIETGEITEEIGSFNPFTNFNPFSSFGSASLGINWEELGEQYFGSTDDTRDLLLQYQIRAPAWTPDILGLADLKNALLKDLAQLNHSILENINPAHYIIPLSRLSALKGDWVTLMKAMHIRGVNTGIRIALDYTFQIALVLSWPRPDSQSKFMWTRPKNRG